VFVRANGRQYAVLGPRRTPCQYLATGNRQLATGNRQLATGNWQLTTGN
jgi:hypothetical protein